MVSPFLGIDPLIDDLVLWLAAFIAGYVQWFILAPKLFCEYEVTTLGLSKVLPNVVPTMRAAVKAKQKPSVLRSRTLPAFDKNGQTPLERALRANSRRP